MRRERRHRAHQLFEMLILKLQSSHTLLSPELVHLTRQSSNSSQMHAIDLVFNCRECDSLLATGPSIHT
jgi:hypothetical protein